MEAFIKESTVEVKSRVVAHTHGTMVRNMTANGLKTKLKVLVLTLGWTDAHTKALG